MVAGEPPPPPVRPLEASAERLYQDDLPLARSLVRVRFDGPVEPVTLRALHTAFRLTLPEGSPLTGHSLGDMPVESVEVVSSRAVELVVRSLIANGSTLHVSASAFSEENDEEVTVPVTTEFTELGVLLAGGVFAFGDLSLVEPRAPETPTAADRDPAIVRSSLETHLDERGASSPVRNAALTLYDVMDDETIPAPKVRAALAALAGTFADAGVRSLLGRDNCTGEPAAFIGFQEPPGDPDLAARVTYDDDGRRILSIRPDLEAAPFELLMPLLAHEAVHCDRLDTMEEEIVASAMDVYLYIHLLISQPELVRDSSPLARNFNIEALAMLNSGLRRARVARHSPQPPWPRGPAPGPASRTAPSLMSSAPATRTTPSRALPPSRSPSSTSTGSRRPSTRPSGARSTWPTWTHCWGTPPASRRSRTCSTSSIWCPASPGGLAARATVMPL